MKKLSTMHDIARLAGVNQSTVSRALSGDPGKASISSAVRRRILQIAKRLEYQPNLTAIALRTGATRTILVVIQDITDAYFSAIIGGIESVLVRENYSMILHSLVHTEPDRLLRVLFRQYRIDGALMLGAMPTLSEEAVLSFCESGIRHIFIGRSVIGPGTMSLIIDNNAGGQLAANHLLALGHRKMAVMRGPRGFPDFPERIKGFREEIARQGADLGEVEIFIEEKFIAVGDEKIGGRFLHADANDMLSVLLEL